jgi:hypothetical protein
VEIQPDRAGLARTYLIFGAIVVAALTARPYAGSWNDGSRLATVECLVDRDTLAIDESIFVKVPHDGPSPYPADAELLQRFGTRDKLLIDGHYYSDKSPVPALYLAAVYKVWRVAGGPSAAERPGLFCLLLTLLSSGLAYVLAVAGVFAICHRVGLDLRAAVLLTVAFGLGTVALPYAQAVNNHVLLLAVAAGVFLLLLKAEGGWTTGGLLVLGMLLGVGYTIDLAAGPMLCLAAGGAVARHGWKKLAVVAAAALPWVLCHHALNYHVGGTLGPANAVPAYLAWPGSPFTERTMTGGWHHRSAGGFALYALDMLFGKRGFLGHNLMLFLPLIALPALLCQRLRERPAFAAGLVWAAGTWLIYAATSSNLSGACCSIRWFVPLLVPGFLAAAVVLRERPELRRDAVVLGIGGLLLGVCMAAAGPWTPRVIPLYWPAYAGTLVAWGITHAWHRQAAEMPVILGERVVVAERTLPERSRVEAEAEAVPVEQG